MNNVIKNFVDTQELHVRTLGIGQGATVTLVQVAGSMRFHFDMEPDAALRMARILTEHAIAATKEAA